MLRLLRRIIVAGCWVAIVSVAAAFVWAYLLADPAPGPGPGPGAGPGAELPGAWWAFMIRTGTLHGGLGLLATATVAAVFRARGAAWCGLIASLIVMGPTLWAARPHTQPVAGSTLTLASFNLHYRNDTPDAAVDAMLACGADVICIQEYTPRWHALCDRRLRPAYPHVAADAREGYYGSAIYSRLPLSDRSPFKLHRAVSTPMTAATVSLDGRDVRVVNVHLRHFGRGQEQEVATLERWMAAERDPTVFAGDYNFTSFAAPAARFAALGYRDALDLAGRGLKTTWPNRRPDDPGTRHAWLLYPGLRIDHVYLCPQLTATDAWTGRTPGSDHSHAIARIGFVPDAGKR